MPYNKQTAWENQKKFLAWQMKDKEHPALAKRAKENYEKMLKQEKEAKKLSEKIAKHNAEYEKTRKLKKSKK